ncbi:serine protease inhibitor 88Ea [Teleopsis dalmanni]|uniref:serine protease inhibitor 88Ea n=1 Tax=Teleopsis dalmanni TaxID=139649 RepID=UPI0018CCE28F|nr:serine protease inhibitor 88Ea [Teleopsis dalmanni]
MMDLFCCFLLGLAVFTTTSIAQENCLSDNSITPPTRVGLVSQLYKGQQAFTVSMLNAITKATPNENIFFSPYSTYHALLLAYFGSRTHSEQELIKALNLDWAKDKNQVKSAYVIEKSNRFNRAKNSPIQFASADKIFFDNRITLNKCMLDHFVDELESMDFKGNSEQCRVEINSWIANVTQNEIPEMLAAGDVTSETELVLANAAYFKGQWESQFDPKATTRDVFFTTPKIQSLVPMMHKRGTYNLANDENLQAYVLDMPYKTSNNDEKNSDISMIIILPSFEENSLEHVLEKLTPEYLEIVLKDGLAREIDVSLPKFEFEQKLELVPILRKMGINSIFDRNADLSGFAPETINFGDAKHFAKIKVDEEGSTAAAATVLFSFRSARPLEPTKFDCNHPFLFLIYDHKSKAVLFTGIYRDPKTRK